MKILVITPSKLKYISKPEEMPTLLKIPQNTNWVESKITAEKNQVSQYVDEKAFEENADRGKYK